MPQLTQQVVNTFIKGLITEAGELTFPTDASVDELNCDLFRDGSRGRRLGVVIETNNTDSTFTISDSQIVSTGTWKNVGGDASLEWLVIQVGSTLHFYNKSSAPLSSHEDSETIDLTTYEHSASNGAATEHCQFSSIEGALVVVSSEINPIYIERDNSAETLSATQISFRVRDFEWQGDTTTYDEESSTSTPGDARVYDTLNTGWPIDNNSGALDTYRDANGDRYPALTHPWYSGKNSSNVFSESEWQKVYGGTTLIGNGRFILDFFDKDRATPSGTSIANETEDSRFTSAASFGNRVFYAGLDSSKNASTLLFSRVIETIGEVGECLQRNDPTGEELSDLLDDDGGVIKITGAVGIKKLHPIGSNLLILADNGVWSLNGVDGVFRATEYSIQKISEVGIIHSETFISAQGQPFWWSDEGIHTIVLDDVSGRPGEQNISINSIQDFYDSIDGEAKLKAKAVYDRTNKRIYWMYADANQTVDSKINNFLILDLSLQAFFPWAVVDQASSTDIVVGAEYYSGFGADDVPLDVITSAGDDVVTSAGDDVVSTQTAALATGSPSIVLLVRNGADNTMTMATFTSEDFLDWGDTNYSSYAEAAYDFVGDLSRDKTMPYVDVLCRVTEDGWEASGNGYVPTNESSIKVSSFWDFKTTASSTAQQGYRLKFIPVVNEGDLTTFGYPYTVVQTRLKLRGKGKSLRLKFESEQGKNFVLLGYGMIKAINDRF